MLGIVHTVCWVPTDLTDALNDGLSLPAYLADLRDSPITSRNPAPLKNIWGCWYFAFKGITTIANTSWFG